MGSYSVAMQRNVCLIHLSVMGSQTVKMVTMNLLKHVVGLCVIIMNMDSMSSISSKEFITYLTEIDIHFNSLNHEYRMSGWTATVWQR